MSRDRRQDAAHPPAARSRKASRESSAADEAMANAPSFERRLGALCRKLRDDEPALCAYLRDRLPGWRRLTARVVLVRELGATSATRVCERAFGPGVALFSRTPWPAPAIPEIESEPDTGSQTHIQDDSGLWTDARSDSGADAVADDRNSLLDEAPRSPAPSFASLGQRRPDPTPPSFLLPQAAGSAFRPLQLEARAGQPRTDAGPKVHETAARATSGAGEALPHLPQLQQSFGRHDLSRVRAHTDSAAAAGARAMGARAFASGDHVAFVEAPSLRTAAHEAAHVIQQRAGVSLPGGVGEVGDRYERHADAVAQLVLEGRSSEALLDELGGPASAPQGGVQHLKYHELSDAQREVVDQHAQQQFHDASEHFEQHIGLLASEDARAVHAADELLDRTVHLAEALYFNTAREKEKSLDEHFEAVFGIKNRPDISGSVPPTAEMIEEVFQAGTLREKLSLFYTAMAENQVFNKMLNEYQSLLDKEREKLGASLKKEDIDHLARVEEHQSLDPYVAQRQKKDHFKRAMDWVQMDIDLERKATQDSLGEKARKLLTREEQVKQKEQDEQLAAVVINVVTGGTITGDETTNQDKIAGFKSAVEVFMRLAAPPQDTKDTPEERLGKVRLAKQPLDEELLRQSTKFSEGYGYLKLVMERVFADAEKGLSATILAKASKGGVEPDGLKKLIKRWSIDDAFKDMGNTFFTDKVTKKRRDDADLETRLGDSLNKAMTGSTDKPRKVKEVGKDPGVDTFPNIDLIVQALKQEEKKAESGQPTDNTAENIAEKRFTMNFFGPSLLTAKRAMEESRKGSDRTIAPPKEQTSDETPSSLESSSQRLTYRELGQAFYTPEEFSRRLKAFKSTRDIPGKRAFDAKAQEEFRQELLTEKVKDDTENKDRTLPWKPGVKFWRLDVKSQFVQASQLLNVRIGAALSGTTDRIMRSAKLLGFEGKALHDVLLACLGYMVPGRDHSYYEIMKAAEPYLDIKPARNPFPDLIIDPNYANGFGYAKMLEYFNQIDPSHLPHFYLSLDNKDALASKMKAPEQPDATYRIDSDHDGRMVCEGQPVKYAVRQPPLKDKGVAPRLRFEWFHLRHESGEARGKAGAVGVEFESAWMHKGVYKIYCLVYLTDKEGEAPVASLRYDQLVYGKELGTSKESEGPKKVETSKDAVSARATFTAWDEQHKEIPITVDFREAYGIIACKLDVPASLVKDGEKSTYWGRVQQTRKLQGQTEATQMFNDLYREDKDIRTLRAEALFEAAKQWEAGHAYEGTGSVNVDIFDVAKQAVLKEHFFYVDRGGKGVDDETAVPAYRTQGGDFESGIKSSVRLVNSRTGELDVSGDAMVWINFADKARMVWWLNNRTDRSYNVYFKVQAEFLKGVTETAVPETEANKKEKNVPVNKGKPIISQDKATHQYAIVGEDVGKGAFPSFATLKQKAIGHMVKMFQWTTFDIESAKDQGATPGGVGILAHPFNESLKKAKDLEIKIRLLTHQNADASEIEALKQQQQKFELEGKAQWQLDYNTRLRKPGKSGVSDDDRRVPGELGEQELFETRHAYVETVKSQIAKVVKSTLGPAIPKVNRVKLADAPKVADTELDEIRGILKVPLETFAKWRADQTKGLYKGMPEEFKRKVVAFAFNELIKEHLGKSTLVNGVDETGRKAILKIALFDDNEATDFETPAPIKVEAETPTQDPSETQPPSDKKPSTAGTTGTTGTTSDNQGSSKDKGHGKGKDEQEDILALIDDKERLGQAKTRAAKGGMRNAGNTCYIASIMQIMALSPACSDLFFDDERLANVPASRANCIRLGRHIIRSINEGTVVTIGAMGRFRQLLIDDGWMEGTNDAEGSQQDAAMFFRFLIEDLFNANIGVRERHDWSKAGSYDRTEDRTERLVQLGGLTNVSTGRTVDELLAGLYEQTRDEPERDGVPIRHRYTIREMPPELTLQIMRYDFNQITQQYAARAEVINVGEQLRIRGAMTPDHHTHVYDLDGFVVHQGFSPKGGHYISYVRRGGEWLRASDGDVRVARPEEVAADRAAAYLYHYRWVERLVEPFPLMGPSEPEVHQQALSEDPSYMVTLIGMRLREHAEDPEWIETFLLLGGAELRNGVRDYLAQWEPLTEQDQRLKRRLGDILESVLRQLTHHH